MAVAASMQSIMEDNRCIGNYGYYCMDPIIRQLTTGGVLDMGSLATL